MTGFAGYLSKDGGSVGKMLEAVCPTDVISTKEYECMIEKIAARSSRMKR